MIIRKVFFVFILLVNSPILYSDIKAMSFIYEEKEPETESVNVRYLVNNKFLRIDNGQSSDDFILFDRNKKEIYSVNRDDQSILVIKNNEWLAPKYDFSIKENKTVLTKAPKIQGKHVMDYSVSVNKDLCYRIQSVPDVYANEMQAFIEYQKVLSGQQVKLLANTPADMQTPCFLIGQVYNAGDYYRFGLPVHEWHSRGYIKVLRSYKQEKIKQELFVLPKGFESYSITD